MSNPKPPHNCEDPQDEGFIDLDFEKTFPHVFWISDWGSDDDYPEGFRYKVLSMRHEPIGDFEVVLIQELSDGSKIEMQHWSVPADSFDASADLIAMLEQEFGVTFSQVDMADVRTFEEFEAKSRQIGWEVS